MRAEPGNLIYTAIRHAVLAGALRYHARRDERVRQGFTRAAKLQSERSRAALRDWIVAGSGEGDG